jgi:polar amino acid transport system permease protein
VILPQALFNMIPSIVSQFVSTIKETTLAYIINVPELTFAAGQINNRLLTKPFEVYFILAISYFIVCWTLTQLANLLERTVAARRTSANTGIPASSLTAAAVGVSRT